MVGHGLTRPRPRSRARARIRGRERGRGRVGLRPDIRGPPSELGVSRAKKETTRCGWSLQAGKAVDQAPGSGAGAAGAGVARAAAGAGSGAAGGEAAGEAAGAAFAAGAAAGAGAVAAGAGAGAALGRAARRLRFKWACRRFRFCSLLYCLLISELYFANAFSCFGAV
jgi:hypothetical protein